ncbi:hypothetical protein ACFV2Z_00230 [Streptomyces sp. NPDC059688]|uniref:Secreted protein n=1 Tax=Streptomyces albidocamelliae TaxID=2981135 RepID=A0ABY6ES48_9ACTN|nr:MULTISPECIES: hypothetical protein [unclassified Streptomyces]PKW09390.1 hypothetical protein BX260_4639 [Streptomyces sp. 5112.2]UXY37216.1 hypothetical protein N8I86_22315 [Streptomyces sp. HUAS 14-6]SEC36509.1 hypothetical protein SAMN05428944_3454 [Streptomyces sp. 1222.5]SED54747.1 hypothetical protein SAMN05216532_4897 [Streptomyces sp. 2231.1]
MPEHVSTLQWTGAVVLTLAGVAWAIVVLRLLRRFRAQALREIPTVRLPVLPPQRQAGPALEKVELTAAERDAFAGLVRQLGGR